MIISAKREEKKKRFLVSRENNGFWFWEKTRWTSAFLEKIGVLERRENKKLVCIIILLQFIAFNYKGVLLITHIYIFQVFYIVFFFILCELIMLM